VEIDTKVTKINGIYHCRLLRGERVLSEMACVNRRDVGFCISYLLRWYDKLGGTSIMAGKSRSRQKNLRPNGKIWFPSQMPVKHK